MKRVSWILVWVSLPATAVFAITSAPQPVNVPTEAWMGLTLLGSLFAAVVAARNPQRRR